MQNFNGEKHRSYFERAEDTNLFVTALSEVADNLTKLPDKEPFISYDDLAKVVGRKIKGADGNLQSARKVLLNERDVIFVCVRTKGLKIASSPEIIEGAKAKTRSAGRLASRTLRHLTCCDFSKLSTMQQLEHNVTATVMSVLQHVTKRATVKQLSGQVEKVQKRLPINETLKAITRI